MGGEAAAVRSSSLGRPGNRPLVVFSHQRCTVTCLFLLLRLSSCRVSIKNVPQILTDHTELRPCGSACRLLTEAGGGLVVRLLSGQMPHCGIKGDGKLLISRWCLVGFHLFYGFYGWCQQPVVFDLLMVPHVLFFFCFSAVAAVVFVC